MFTASVRRSLIKNTLCVVRIYNINIAAQIAYLNRNSFTRNKLSMYATTRKRSLKYVYIYILNEHILNIA